MFCFLSCRSMFCFLKFHSCLHKVVLCVTAPCRSCRYKALQLYGIVLLYMYCTSAEDLLHDKSTGQTLCLCSTAQVMSSHSAIQAFRGGKATCIEICITAKDYPSHTRQPDVYLYPQAIPMHVCIFCLCSCIFFFTCILSSHFASLVLWKRIHKKRK